MLWLKDQGEVEKMPKISKSASLSVSIVLTVVFFLVLTAAAIVFPGFLKLIGNAALRPIEPRDRVLILAAGYLVLALAMLADWLLLRLLLRVRAGEVFTARSVALIRGVSWCAFAIALCFLLMSWYYLVSLVLSFTAALLGVSLRVVKNVIEEATAIKAENDLTV